MNDIRTLEEFRAQLDQLDAQIVDLLASRFDVCRNVARYKKEWGIPMMQPARVQAVKQRAAERARLAGVNEEFMVALYTAIIAEACRLEDDIIGAPLPPAAARADAEAETDALATDRGASSTATAGAARRSLSCT